MAKELLILAYTLNVGGKSKTRVKEYLSKFATSVKQSPHEKYDIREIIIPVKTGENKVECIFPKEYDDEVLVRINESHEMLNKFLNKKYE